MKKFISVLLCIALIFAMSAIGVSAKTEKILRFNDDGSFKIMQFADLQDDEILNSVAKDFIRTSVMAEQPDLVVLTGDNSAGYACASPVKSVDTALSKKAINEYMSIFEELKVPVAAVFGNHDDDGNLATKEELLEMYQQYDCFIGYDAAPEIYGCATYNVPIYASKSNDVKFNLWMFDSNTYDEVYGGYDYVHPDQIAWYEKTEAELTRTNGGTPVPSMAFQHIIVDEIWDCIEPIDTYVDGAYNNNGKYYIIKPELFKGGYFKEWPCPGTQESNQFEAMKQNGNVLAMFFGHDHNNSFEITYQGIDIVATPGFTFQSYGNEDRGARVIELNENNTSTYTTRVVHWQNYYKDNVMAMAHYNMYAETNVFKQILNGMLYVLLFPIKSIFGYAF